MRDPERNSNVEFMDAVACDNKCYPISGASGMDGYIEQVELFLKEVFIDLGVIMNGDKQLPEYEYPSLRHITGFIKE